MENNRPANLARWAWALARATLMGVVLVLALSIASILHDGEWTEGERYLARASDRMIGLEEYVCWWKVKIVVSVTRAADGPADFDGTTWPTGARWRRATIERTPIGSFGEAAELGWPWPIATSYEIERGGFPSGTVTQSDLGRLAIGSLQLEYPTHVYLPGLVAWISALGALAWAAIAAFNWCVATIRRRRRIAGGQCVSCGYSMRGTDSIRCPECGASPSTPSRREIAPAPRDTLPK